MKEYTGIQKPSSQKTYKSPQILKLNYLVKYNMMTHILTVSFTQSNLNGACLSHIYIYIYLEEIEWEITHLN